MNSRLYGVQHGSCLISALLNLYEYSPRTRTELFRVLRQLQPNLWIPHQAALEYQSGRLRVISEQLQRYAKAEQALNNAINDFAKLAKIAPVEQNNEGSSIA